jgi:hypothetical protein
MVEAIFFLAGAVLFLLAVLFFVFLWQDRTSLVQRRDELQEEMSTLKEQRVELDIWQRELQVWEQGLKREHLALEQAREELRMLTASQPPTMPTEVPQSYAPSGVTTPGLDSSRDASDGGGAERERDLKNLKQNIKDTKVG